MVETRKKSSTGIKVARKPTNINVSYEVSSDDSIENGSQQKR